MSEHLKLSAPFLKSKPVIGRTAERLEVEASAFRANLADHRVTLFVFEHQRVASELSNRFPDGDHEMRPV